MGRTKAFIYNSISTALLQVVTMLSGFIIPRYMLVYYGSEINGLIASILQFIAYFNLVEAGISGAAVYALYKPLAENDIPGISAVVSAAKKFYIQSGYIFVLMTVVLALVYPFFIHSSVMTKFEIAALVMLLGANGCFEFFTLAKYRALLTADQKMYVISLASVIYLVLNVLTVLVLARMEINIVILRAVIIVTIFVRSIILTFYCKSKYPYLNYSMKFPNDILDKRWDALMLQILMVIICGAPIVIITLILKDLQIVSVYSIYSMIMSGIVGILGIFKSGLGSSFGDVIARNELNVLQKAYREFECFYYAMISVVFGVTFVMIMPFVRIYTRGITDVNYDIPKLGFLFTINALLFIIKSPQGMLVISAGMYRETRWQMFTQGAIVVVGGIALTPFLGIEGVLYASMLSNLYRDIDLLYFIPKNITKLPVKETFIRLCVMCINICATSFVYKCLFQNDVQTYQQWFFCSFVITSIATIIVLFTNFLVDRKTLIGALKRFLVMMN